MQRLSDWMRRLLGWFHDALEGMFAGVLATIGVSYQLPFKLPLHRMFTLRENMLLFTKRMRKYELEPV